MSVITGTVVRGYITRFAPDEEWVAVLTEFDGDELVDGDVIPYYVQGEDGKFYEYVCPVMPDCKVYLEK